MLEAREIVGPDRAPRVGSDVEDRQSRGGHHRRVMVCRRCRSPITSGAHAAVIDGGHQHTFFNPAGVMYEISCWSAAPGCLSKGQPTFEFTWFPGFRWSYAICGVCGDLLGWRFTDSEGGFWGLITNRLVEEEEEREL